MGLYKDYGPINMFFSKAFFNYTMIIILLFGLIILIFYLALAGFYQKIIKLSIIYKK